MLVDEEEAQAVFLTSAPSVVSVLDYKLSGGSEVYEGVGSGFAWDTYGHIVTNYHCVSKFVLNKKTQVVKVGIADERGNRMSWKADVIGTDAMHDLAVLRIDSPPELLRPIKVGTAADLKVGQSVYAIGNPDGYDRSFSAGVVSALNRGIPAPTGTRIYGCIQTDAQINGGNSGGPLVDSAGRLVGVATATFTRSGTGRGSGVNFALPAELVMQVVPNLIIYGTASGRGTRSG